jgi:hypothetical protein
MHTDKLKYKELTHLIIKGFYEVYTELGGFLESVYENAMTIVLQHEAQLLNYLKATTIEVGLLMNFGYEPTFKRLIYNKQQKQSV